MKKLLGIVVLGLLFTSSVFAKKAEYPKLPKDVAWGDKYFKSLVSKDYKDYGMQVVDKKDGHPVRLGNQSIRFEVRPGDCSNDTNPDGWNDCEHDSERHELSGQRTPKGTYWYAWSIYFSEDHFNGYPTFVTLGQFHQHGKYSYPPWMFTNYKGGYWFRQRISNTSQDVSKTLKIYSLLSRKEVLGKWNDVLVNVKWSHKKDGFIKVLINGKILYDYKGRTKAKGTKSYFKFGIYRSEMKADWLYSEFNKDKLKGLPTQIIYYDEVRRLKGESCKKLKLEDLGYSCEELEGQKISKIDKGEEASTRYIEYIALIKNKTDDSVLIKVRAASQELAIEEAMKKCTEKHEEGCYVHYSNQVGFGQ